MIDLSALFDAYLDINILLVFGCVLWAVTAWGLRVAGLGYAYTAQLWAMRSVLLAIFVSPILAIFIIWGMGSADTLHQNPVNLSDFIVAQYLQGRFQMDPARLQELLSIRRQMTVGVARADSVYLLIAGVMLCVAGLLVMRLIFNMVALAKVIDDSFSWRRFGRVDLRLSETTTIPFSTRGLRRRIIVLPVQMLSEPEDLRIALGHELQHLRQRDVDWEIGMEMLRPLFFWNPAYYIWRRWIEELRELSCDRQVLVRKGYDVTSYCECLLRVCHNSLKRRSLLMSRAPIVALVQTESRLFGHRSANILKNRMMALLEGKTERRSRSLATLLLAPLIVLTVMAAVSIQRPGDWSQDRLMLSTIVNLDRLEQWNAVSGLKQRPY